MSLLQVRDLRISFQSSPAPVQVVSGLDFSIEESEVFGLAGESGCGKSISALAIMGILPRHAFALGEILFNGRDLMKLDQESMRQLRGNEISMVFQEPMTSLNPVLTVGYQIAEVFMTHRNLSKRDSLDRAVELLRAVKIRSPELRIKEYPHQLSGGMRQRVMIATAIACNPRLLIADEPTTALDVTIQAQILDLLHQLREDRTMSVLLITHDLGIISENASRVGIMYAGRLVELARTEDIFSNPRHPYTQGLLESIPREKGLPLHPIPGSVPRPEDLPAGCAFAGRCAYAEEPCKTATPVLDEVFPGHFVRCIRTKEIQWNSSGLTR